MTSEAFHTALNSLSVFEDIDLIVAPRTPTENMVRMAVDRAQVDPETVRVIYDTMLRIANSDICRPDGL